MKLKFPVREEVGEIFDGQHMSIKGYVESIRTADLLGLSNLGRFKGEDAQGKRLKTIVAEEDESNLSIQPDEELINIEFFSEKFGYRIQIKLS